MTSYDPRSGAPVTSPTVDVDEGSQHPVRRATLLVSRAISYIVYAYVVVVEIILFIGFLLLLLGANPSSSFVDWIYRSLDRAMRPFRGIFEPIQLGTNQADVASVFETSILFAMIIYAIVALAIHALLEWLNSRLARLDREDAAYRQQQLISQTVAATQAEQAEQAAYLAARRSPAPGSPTPPTPPPAPPGP